jgi:hypothetical protein
MRQWAWLWKVHFISLYAADKVEVEKIAASPSLPL